MSGSEECKICFETVSEYFISKGICENCAVDPIYRDKQDYSRFEGGHHVSHQLILNKGEIMRKSNIVEELLAIAIELETKTRKIRELIKNLEEYTGP